MSETAPLAAIDFAGWLAEHRPNLKPPVGNAQIWPNREFMVTVVAGPNARNDFHINEGEEFFWQLEGDMHLRTIQDGKVVDVPIRQGEIFLLPGNVPHSPQRPAGTLGLVIERRRLDHEIDQFLWICEGCGAELGRESLHLTDIVAQLPPAFAKFWADTSRTTCRSCGKSHTKP